MSRLTAKYLSSLSLALILLPLAPVRVAAAPPTLAGITPRGVERGKATLVVLTGTNLTPRTRLVLPFMAAQKFLPDAKLNPARVRLQLTVNSTVPLGIYPVRVVTEDGISALLLFSVDAFPNVDEVEDNNTFAKAQKVQFPVIVNGQCAGGDVDFFRFTVKKGQRVVVETEAARLGSGIVPQIRVTDSRQRYLASDDSQKVRGDCRVMFTAPEAGDYVVEISDSRYRGGNPPIYHLKIADYDFMEEVFPLGGRRGQTVNFTLRGGTLARPVHVRRTLSGGADRQTLLLGLDRTARVGMLSPRVALGDLPERTRVQAGSKDPKVLDVVPPLTINGRLGRPGLVDRFQFPVKPGQRFRIAVQAEVLGSYLDGVLRVTNQAGLQLALVDDVALPAAPGQAAVLTADPSADVAVPEGSTLLIIELRDQRHRGGVNFGYRLTIKPTLPDFIVHQPVSEANVPRGGSVALTVPVTRRGYQGPIQLTVQGLPAGVTVQGGYVPEGGNHAVLTLTASANARLPADFLSLHIEGLAKSMAGEIRRRAEQRVVFSQDPSAATSALTLRQFTLALTVADPFAVRGPVAVELVKGYPANVPVTVTRAAGQAALAVEVTGLMPPPVAGQLPVAPSLFTFKPATAVANVSAATFTLTAAANAPEGKNVHLLIQGKAKINNADRTVTGSAVALTVLRPFTVELLTPKLMLRPGGTVTLKGKLRRQSVFKEVVQLTLPGLPAGVTLASPPRPVAGNQNEFQIDLRADPKAAAAMANLTLTFATTIGGMAYAHPAVGVPVSVLAGK